MQRIITRTVTVEVLYTDDPEHEEGQRWDELSDSTDEQILASEKSQRLSEWFATTEYAVLDDMLKVSAS